MRILIVSNLYPPNAIGGYERLCHEVATELVARGQEIVVLTSDFGDATASYPGQRIHRGLQLMTGPTIYEPFKGSISERGEIERENARLASALIESEKPDVIFVWNLFFLGASFFDSLRAYGIRTVVMLTDNWYIVMRQPAFMSAFFERHTFGDMPFGPGAPASRRRFSLKCLRRWLSDRLHRHQRASALPTPASAAIFGSHFMHQLHRAAGLEFTEERVIHNGIRQRDYPADAFPDRTALVHSSELRLLFAGRITEFKGLHTALDALPLLSPEALGVGRIRLSIVGDTHDSRYVDDIKVRVRQYRGPVEITFHAPVAEDALFALFAEHDIYLFPSLYEPFSLTLIHALAAGIPTVASDVGGNPEIVRDRETGLLFRKSDPAALAQAIGTLAGDPQLRARIALDGRRTAAGYTFENMVAAMQAFLQRGGRADPSPNA